MKIRIYDTEERLLVGPTDGVWEREPARIEVTIDQARIRQAFAQIDAAINQAVQEALAALQNRYDGPEYRNVVVTASPPSWSAETSPMTVWPTALYLRVSGPGTEQTFPLQPKQQVQSQQYTGTVVPTMTTWGSTLDSEDYQAAAEDFEITVPYVVQLDVTYERCEAPGVDPDTGDPLPDEERSCTPGTDGDSLSGTFTITVQGDAARFEVYEPNARGLLAHTAEWAEYHARDRYPDSKPNDFYAGERILARLQLEDRHKHPHSGKYPRIVSAAAWIRETGRASDPLVSTLFLQQQTSTQWGGPKQQVEKLGLREAGVDTPLMGDKQRGFAKDESYSVQFMVQFGFGVRKGFVEPDKTAYSGHERKDYQVPFTIIANAWERQGIRNHTTQ
ncbi:MAG: hypothetical protein H0Z34_18050 [Brevibacillus sp.]|nr:hypothetical protein [Brevibacillus sp.]